MRPMLIATLLLLLLPACHRKDSAPAAAADSDKAPASALLAFGAACNSNAECASNACNMGGNGSYCSIACKQATEAKDCPVPLTNGQCNKRGFCKKP
jgi:hypothetical protein